MIKRPNLRLRAAGLAGVWRRHGWLILGLLWAAALILGYAGFARSARATGGPAGFFDVAYRTLQLVPMNSGDVARAGWELNAARFVIPILTAWTALRALFSLFRDRWMQLYLRFWRDHVIICGLSRKGWLLARGFAARGDRVVVIEADESHDLIGPCRECGIVVLLGDATDSDVLERAGVLWARHMVAVTDDDGANADIAIRVAGLLRAARGRRRIPLTCAVHLVDPQLYELARTREMELEEGVPLRLEMFNVFDRGARLLWSQFGPSPAAGQALGAGCQVHLLVVGLGRLGESLVVCAARDWHARLREVPCRANGRLRIGVIDLNAGWKCRALGLRYPQLAGVCDLIPLEMNVRWPEFHEGAYLAGGAGYPPVGTVFVCFDDDSLALRTGLAIHDRLRRSGTGPTPVVVRMAEAGGLARLVEHEGDGPGAFANLHAFGLLDRTCTPETILGGTHEVLASEIHAAYVRQQRALGQTEAGNPSMAEWDHLDLALRESNRAEADGIFRHLATLGYTLAPLSDWDAAFFCFSDEEVAQLAEREHNRFVAERVAQGWRYTDGPKETQAKLNPALLPWDKLPAPERAKAGDTMRNLPATLARAGFQIVRLPSAARAAPPPPDRPPDSTNTQSGRREAMARAIHERYRQNQQDIKPPDDPAMQPWEELAESLRESNRAQAAGIEATLRHAGYGIRSASGPEPAPCEFAPGEVEAMAEVAHIQWAAERRRAGWVQGAVRDVERKTTPYLDIPYDELPDGVKEWDRQAVRAIPEVLAAAGLEVYRLG